LAKRSVVRTSTAFIGHFRLPPGTLRLVGCDKTGEGTVAESTSGEVAGGPGPRRAPVDDPNTVYALGSSRGESARLERQADELAPDSSALLDRVGLRRGDSAIDVGCGPRGIIELLHERVMPGGRVIGLDGDPTHVTMASEFVANRGLNDVEIVCADARQTGLEAASFDLVHHRTLLVTVPEPAALLAEMVRLARPSGVVAGLEPDTEHAICYPPHPAFDRLSEIFMAVFTRNGADPRMGRRLPELYRQAGLEDVQLEARAGVYPPGHSRRTIRADLVRAMRPQVLETGLAAEDELDEIDRAVREHLANPETVVMPGLMFLAWGRNPAPP
jgi:SAM-dependent methyltransferase